MIKKAGLFCLLFLFIPVAIPWHASGAGLPVFPGAQGFGIHTPAGRGGKILRVTNLNDAGPGSLRAALETSGPRTILFEVGGRIEIKSALTISHPFCTVAGQSAPDPGIMISGNTLEITTHDVLVQHLAVRVGDRGKGKKGRTADALRIQGKDAYNIVLDHLSASWSVDELVGIGDGAHDITLSNSILAEPLNQSIHPKGEHGYGILAGDGTERLALIGNFIAHAAERLPRFQGGSFLMANCLIYNKGGRDFCAIGSKRLPTALSCVGNLFQDGSNGFAGNALAVGDYAAAGTRIHQRDNVYPKGKIITWSTSFDPRVSTPPPGTWPKGFQYDPAVLKPGSGVVSRILRSAGTRPGRRDSVDARLLKDLRSGGGRIIDSPSQVGGFPEYPSTHRTLRIDFPPHEDSDGDGYTDVEELLHRWAADVERG